MSLRIGAMVAGGLAAGFVLVALGWAGLAPLRALYSPLVGHQAPELVVRTFDGQRLSLGELWERPLVLNFWASWCGPCRAEIPILSQAAQVHGEVAFLGVDVRDNEAAARDFLGRAAPAYPTGVIVAGSSSAYGVDAGLPTTFFIEPGGRVRDRSPGALTQIGLEGYLRELAR